VVYQVTCKWRLSGYTTGQPITTGVVTSRHLHRVALRVLVDRLKCKESLKYAGAVAEHVAGGGADFGVREIAERFLDNVDEAGLAL
jgi:hypothetical protein